MPIHSRDWVAVEKAVDFSGREFVLVVGAEVELLRAGDEPFLEEAIPQGINSKILILELHIKGASGPEAKTWKLVGYERRSVQAGSYSQVAIRCGGEELAIVRVTAVRS